MNNNEILSFYMLPIILLVGMYLMIFLPQKRRDKKVREMLNALEVGNQVTTIGGIVGKIMNIKEDEIVIETSIEKTNLKIMRWAIKDSKKIQEA